MFKLSLLMGTLLLASALSSAGEKENSKNPVYRVKFNLTSHQVNIDVPGETKVQQVVTDNHKPSDLAGQNSSLSTPSSKPTLN